MSNSFLRALQQAAQGKFVTDKRSSIPVDVRLRELRTSLGLSQEEFAMRYDMQLANVIYYEQPGNKISESARIVISMIERDPEGMREDMRTKKQPD